MSLRYKRSLLANTGPTLLTVIIDNDDAIAVGDAVKCINGNLEVVTAGDALFGIVHDVVDKAGNSLAPEKGSLSKLGGATISSGTVTVDSDNETVDQIAAKVDVSVHSIYSVDVDGTIGATNSSNKPGAWIDLSDKDSLDETTASRTITNGGQVLTVPSLNPANGSRDDDDTTRLLVKILESEVYGQGKVTS